MFNSVHTFITRSYLITHLGIIFLKISAESGGVSGLQVGDPDLSQDHFWHSKSDLVRGLPALQTVRKRGLDLLVAVGFPAASFSLGPRYMHLVRCHSSPVSLTPGNDAVFEGLGSDDGRHWFPPL